MNTGAEHPGESTATNTRDHHAVVDADESTHPAGRISAPVIAALEQAWADIRARHGEVPAAVVVLGAGSTGAPAGQLRLGHFAAMRWHHQDAQLPEVFVGGEGLAYGPADVLGTLLGGAVADSAACQQRAQRGRVDVSYWLACGCRAGRAGPVPAGEAMRPGVVRECGRGHGA